MATPDVSIVIPCYGKVEYTIRCLTTLAEHTPADRYEVVLVDNASTDATPDLCAQLDGDVVVVRNEENLGFSKACNQGAAASSGRHLLFLNNDTELRPGWLEPLLDVLDREPDVGAVGSKLLFPDGTIQHAGVHVLECEDGRLPILPVHRYYRDTADLELANRREDVEVVTAACVLVRRAAFAAVGGFDEAYWCGYEDVELCFALHEAGWRVVYEPASVLVHHESVSGPERFREVTANEQRLVDRWHGRWAPSMLRTATGTVRPHPSRCRIDVQVLGSDERAVAATVRGAVPQRRGADRIWTEVDVDVHGATCGEPDGACDWLLRIRAGVVPAPGAIDALAFAALLPGVTTAGPVIGIDGRQGLPAWGVDPAGASELDEVAGELRAQAGRYAPVPVLDPRCVLQRTGHPARAAVVVGAAFAQEASESTATPVGAVPGGGSR